MTTVDELLPCPFCGGTPELLSGGPGNHFVRCKSCNSASDDRSKLSTIHLWNSRPILERYKAMEATLAHIHARSTEPEFGDERRELAHIRQLSKPLEPKP